MSLVATGVQFKLSFNGEELGYGFSSSLGQSGASEALEKAVKEFTQTEQFKKATYELSGQLDIKLEYLVHTSMPL